MIRLIKKVIHILRTIIDKDAKFIKDAYSGKYDAMPDEEYLKKLFKIRVGYALNLDSPRSFNEKLQWLKLNEHFEERTRLVDKFLVRDYIASKIGTEYLIPLIGVWNSFDEIDFSKIPTQFVLKVTHNSGGVIVCKDKDKFNFKKAKKKCQKWLSTNYYMAGREYPYKNIIPRIIIETYMYEDGSSDLRDYKLMCFNGKVKCSFVCSNRKSQRGLNVNFYDEEWNPMPFERHYKRNKTEIKKPQNYSKMVEIAELLAKDMKFVRIDFYEINGRVYFGEITFYPGSGMEEFRPLEWDYILGDWIKLN